MHHAFRGEHSDDLVKVEEPVVFNEMREERDSEHEGEVVVGGGNGLYP